MNELERHSSNFLQRLQKKESDDDVLMTDSDFDELLDEN